MSVICRLQTFAGTQSDITYGSNNDFIAKLDQQVSSNAKASLPVKKILVTFAAGILNIGNEYSQ